MCSWAVNAADDSRNRHFPFHSSFLSNFFLLKEDREERDEEKSTRPVQSTETHKQRGKRECTYAHTYIQTHKTATADQTDENKSKQLKSTSRCDDTKLKRRTKETLFSKKQFLYTFLGLYARPYPHTNNRAHSTTQPPPPPFHPALPPRRG